MLQEASVLLKKHFGYSSFRKGQEKIISSILAGTDTFGIMPTGGGKSICYQIPALLLPGITLVVSPLISLMKDQVDALDNLGIPSTFINSSLSQSELEKRIRATASGKYKLLYIAPERLESDRFRETLKDITVSLVAIDEAHCVSQWGHDFRPSYLSVLSLLNEFDKRPIVAAFTATATEEVKEDIIRALSLRSPNVYVTGFDRENLFFKVIKGVRKPEYILDYLHAHPDQSGIIYAATRKEVDKLYETLVRRGFSTGRYHAGMSDKERTQNQEAFLYDNIQVMIATNAFGMGIDKSNVRFVMHLNMPKNMEAYYQEAGRGGRDGDPAECILLYSASDVHIQKFLIEQTLLAPERKKNEYKKLQEMMDYCHTSQCQRKYILEYFGEEEIAQTCAGCGNCMDGSELSDITVEAQKIFSCIKRMGERFGIALTANVLRGSDTKKIKELGFKELPTYGIMQEYTLQDISDMIQKLAAEGYLTTKEGQYPVIRLSANALPVLKNTEKVLLKVQKKQPVSELKDTSLFAVLRALRKEIAQEERIPPYVVFHDSTLQEMSRRYPVDRKSLLAVTGVGENKVKKYGDRFMEVILQYCVEHGLIPQSPKPATAPQKEKKTPSHVITYEMYKDGVSVEDIMKERGLSPITIQDHFTKCAQEGLEVRWDDFIPAEQEELILASVKEIGPEKLRPIKDSLPGEIGYSAIKAVICKHYGV
jgi:ATP-dependent DNA helicase RecQ